MLPLLGESFNGQLETEDRSLEGREEREKNQEKEDSPGQAPEVLTPESTHAQTFPVRHPDRFPSHRPDNLVPPAPQPPRRSRDHNWKQLGTTECSTTCGKGKPVWKAKQGRKRKAQPMRHPSPHKSPARWLAHMHIMLEVPKITYRLIQQWDLKIQKIHAHTSVYHSERTHSSERVGTWTNSRRNQLPGSPFQQTPTPRILQQ